MKDYSAMSDFEINKAVAILVRPEIRGWDCHDISGRACFVINSNTSKRVQFGFSFTSDPADAWPIIVANSIDIIQDTGLGCAIATSSAVQMFQREDVHIEQDENGLRAAMIVYLQMMEQKS